jgi:HK97 family phage major capsid protein
MPEETKKPTAEDVKAWLKDEVLPVLKTEVAPIVADIVDERVSKAMEKTAQTANADGVSSAGKDGSEICAADIPLKVRQRKAARYLLALAASRGERKDVAVEFGKRMNDPFVNKALGESSLTTGGFMVPQEMGEYIDSLGATAVMRSLGARVVPIVGGQMLLPAGDSGATMSWVGENQVAGSSQPAGRQVNLTLKKGMVIIPLSNDLLKSAGMAAQDWAEREGRRAYERGEDLAFIRGAGTAYSPMGMLYHVLAANKFNITHAGATATMQEVWTDLGKAILKLANLNVPMVRCAWTFAKRTEWYLKTLLNSLNLPALPEMSSNNTLFGFPFASTTQIPITNDDSGDAADDETEIYFADMESMVIGQEEDVEIEVIRGAAYYDSTSGAVVSGVSQDQTTLVLKRRVDFVSLYQGKDIAVINACDWGTGL